MKNIEKYFLLLLLLCPFKMLHAACLDTNTVTSVMGTLSEETFPGAPNYEDVKKGDQPETVVIAALDVPVCLSLSEDNTTREIKSEKLQLVFTGHHTPHILSGLYKKNLTVTGKLFEAVTGHHHTPILIEVQSVDYLASVKKVGVENFECHEVLEKSDKDSDRLFLSVRNADKEILRHTLVYKNKIGEAISLELGAYKRGVDDVMLYTYWEKSKEATTSPEGVRLQKFRFMPDGNLVQALGKTNVQIGDKSNIAQKTGEARFSVLAKDPPREYQDQINLFLKMIQGEFKADFVIWNDERFKLKEEVLLALKRQRAIFSL